MLCDALCRYEVLAMLQHSNHLEAEYGAGPHTISVPRLRPADGSELSIRPPYEVRALAAGHRAALSLSTQQFFSRLLNSIQAGPWHQIQQDEHVLLSCSIQLDMDRQMPVSCCVAQTVGILGLFASPLPIYYYPRHIHACPALSG